MKQMLRSGINYVEMTDLIWPPSVDDDYGFACLEINKEKCNLTLGIDRELKISN